jgi:hypothetical protein
MNKVLLALTILGAGGGAFLTARQSTTQLQREADDNRGAWLTQTQLVAVAQKDRAALSEHVRQLREVLAQAPTATENPLWSAFQTNRVGHLPPELRERLLEELGFNWQSSEEFIVVSKETIHDIWMRTIQDCKLTEIASTVLALTPAERSQVEAVMQRVQTDFNDWAQLHTERTEPKGDVVAQYTLLNDPALSVSNNFAKGVFDAVGKQRAELILPDIPEFLFVVGIRREPLTMIVKRSMAGNEQRLKVEIFEGTEQASRYGGRWASVSSRGNFPPAFRPVFPNGWADVAEREGFELPEEPGEK